MRDRLPRCVAAKIHKLWEYNAMAQGDGHFV